MNGHERRLALQATLKALHEYMMSDEYEQKLVGLNEDELREAGLVFFQVYWAYNRTKNQVLKDIREELDAASVPLETAIEEIDNSLGNIRSATEFISGVSAVLNQLKQVLSFLV